ncbi:hypothetical protein FRACYDRAFT_246240 [Fragilariopsis cylindrus CCMP1102]|uniref:Uncharacterized protein n=1 Tax=Fragilariopsis cylindrus CCMP1102 TaxID=635003 RepID=A0A1E7EYN9_9STRA|nr:hypothetical protein FRACYDRAFT_246240 [Fragilariopsis cylindrus CCMP1102]|eukprot:OEU11128.1 hypothetical protein FRACYDRAFT_246240 [Fragilariopsis cylindrus CCMP1102]
MVSQKWNLLLDARDDDDLYLIIYYAVYMFADEDLSNYHEYQLTYQAVRVCETNSDEWDEVIVEDWKHVGGHTIDLNECTVDEAFSGEEMALLMNYHGEIQCKRVFQWCLARYGDKDDETSFEFQAAQMQNYMPRYYTGNKVITEHGQKGRGGIWKQRRGTGILVMLIVLFQQWIFCCTYHSIGKGNGAEAKYGLSTDSNLHGWGPNLAACYFNMTLKNTYKVYKLLIQQVPSWNKRHAIETCINK